MSSHLDIDRCPWCKTATPTMKEMWSSLNRDPLDPSELVSGRTEGDWNLYMCTRCRKLVLQGIFYGEEDEEDFENETVLLPDTELKIDESIPQRAADFLRQAQDSIDSPDASTMVCASALDMILQEKGLPKTEGNLNSRIDKAASRHLITEDMAKWAHQIRLIANDGRHPDKKAPPISKEDAKQAFEFAITLAHILFVLPARVTRGIEESTRVEREGGD